MNVRLRMYQYCYSNLTPFMGFQNAFAEHYCVGLENSGYLPESTIMFNVKMPRWFNWGKCFKSIFKNIEWPTQILPKYFCNKINLFSIVIRQKDLYFKRDFLVHFYLKYGRVTSDHQWLWLTVSQPDTISTDSTPVRSHHFGLCR